ncbi:MAG TPA: flagellin [Terracidiphilus sp.]|jgi:flagellin
MSLGVLNNLSAVYAENNLNNTSNSLTTVLQQLSSGSKINSGADDAAGLSLVNGLQANQQALTQSQTNATEGVGLLQVADGALSQVTSLLNRAVTLATEASNGTLNSTQDLAANQEYQSILSEVSNIGSTTTYNQEQVFNSNTNIYTGDSSSQGASVDALNIRSLSSSNLGDTDGTMAYSSGANNVFLDLSTSGQNAAVTDTLGTTTQTTTIAVSYLTKGANGSAVSASANISVGAGTNYANTADGLISAINNSGLGITASFGTAAQAGSGATATAVGANATNSALLTTSTDTGIIISGQGVGVNNNSSSAGYSNGAGEVGTLTVSSSSDLLGGTLAVTGSDGQSHSITLGAANSTDTLANLEATVNAENLGITASINTASVTNASGTHAAGTVLTFTSSDSNVTVAGTSITDAQSPTALSLTAAVGAQTAAGAVAGTLTANSATDTLTGILTLTAGTAGTTANINLNGQTVTQFMANATDTAAVTAAGLTVTANSTNTELTFTQTAAQAAGATVAVATGSQIQDSAASTGAAVVSQTNDLGIATAGTLGTVSVSNANDSLNSGTLNITGIDGVAQTYTLGTSGSTDNLTDLAAAINAANGAADTGGITATVNSAGTVLTLAAAASAGTGPTTGVADPMMYGSGITTSLSLTGTPTTGNNSNATTLGTLSLPTGGASGDTLSGSLTIGTEQITLGTAATNSTPGTANMKELEETINAGNYGVTATLNSAGTAMTFTSADSNNISVTPTVSAALDSSDSSAALTWSTANQGSTSSAYYSIGISGAVEDTSTGANTTTALTKGNSFDNNGSGGTATISYSDAAGASLSATDLSNQTDAQTALTDLNAAIADVSAQDGYIGAQINTLNSVSQVLSTQQENVQSAQNAVQATDYASATSNMSKYEILSQTGISALAQANSMQQEVTKLLQ